MGREHTFVTQSVTEQQDNILIVGYLLFYYVINQSKYMYYDLNSIIDTGTAYRGLSVQHVLLNNPQYLKFMENNGYMEFTPRVQVLVEIAITKDQTIFRQDQMIYFIQSFCQPIVLS